MIVLLHGMFDRSVDLLDVINPTTTNHRLLSRPQRLQFPSTHVYLPTGPDWSVVRSKCESWSRIGTPNNKRDNCQFTANFNARFQDIFSKEQTIGREFQVELDSVGSVDLRLHTEKTCSFWPATRSSVRPNLSDGFQRILRRIEATSSMTDD